MKLLKILMVISLLAIAGNLTAGLYMLQKDCNKVEAKVVVEDTSNGQNNGQVRVNLISGDLRTVKYIFCDEDGKVLNESRFETNSLDGLKRGKYLCIISTSDCSKKISFTIK